MSGPPLFATPKARVPPSHCSQQDRAVQSTNDDAAQSKFHAITLGYWRDTFINLFVNKPIKKTVEINRGYFARTQTVWAMTKTFIEHYNGDCQIINIGAGSDTLFWRLVADKLNVKYFVEMDLQETVSKKRAAILNSERLLSALPNLSAAEKAIEGSSRLWACPYFLQSVDLRNSDKVLSLLGEMGLEREKPTLMLAECVLIYLPSAQSRQLLTTLAAHFSNAAFFNYEQVNMNDRFGQVMIANLRARSCDLPGEEECGSVERQITRFQECQWSRVQLWTMQEVYQALPRAALDRIERIEFLDEREVIDQLFGHYCFVLAATALCDFPMTHISHYLSGVI